MARQRRSGDGGFVEAGDASNTGTDSPQLSHRSGNRTFSPLTDRPFASLG